MSPIGTRSTRKPEDFFEDGLVDRLIGSHGEVVDVHRWCRWVIDFSRRKHVANPDGLLVSKVTEEAARARRGAPTTAAGQAAEMERYGAFQVEVYRLVATSHLGPSAIADYLEESRKNGLPLINTRTIDRLRSMGDSWPEVS